MTFRLSFLALGALLPAAAAASPFNVRDYGAVGDGRTLDTGAIARTVAACVAAGGGTVEFSAGRYLTGSIQLKSHVTVQLDAGAVVLYSPNPDDSPLVPVRWEGTNVWTHAPLIYANGCDDIAIVGRGTLNGQGENWWWRAGYDPAQRERARPAREAWLKLLAEIEAGRKTTAADFTEASQFLRPPLVEIYGCRDVLVDGVTITDSPFWHLHPVYSEHVVIHAVSLVSWGVNGDGIDVDSCRDVRISDCFFRTGDDCIVIKSGKENDGRRVNRPCEFVAIDNCVMYHGHGGVAIGSETVAGVHDVAVSNIITDGTDYGIRIKSAVGRGGLVDNVRCDNVLIENPGKAGIEVTSHYTASNQLAPSGGAPVFRNLAFSHVTISGAGQVVNIEGLPQQPIEDLRFADLIGSGRSGFVCEDASGVGLYHVTIRANQGEPFRFTRVQDLVRE